MGCLVPLLSIEENLAVSKVEESRSPIASWDEFDVSDWDHKMIRFTVTVILFVSDACFTMIVVLGNSMSAKELRNNDF